MKTIYAAVIALALAPVARADGFTDATSALRSGDPARGAVLFHDLAQSGDRDAMHNLALLYRSGLGVPKSSELALYWAWRARLEANPASIALLDLLSENAGKETRKAIYDRLKEEISQEEVTGAPRSLVKLALVEQGLSAKPDRIQIFTWAAMAVAMGYLPATEMRDDTLTAMSPKDQIKAETFLMTYFSDWCVRPAAAGLEVCALFGPRS